MIANNFLVRLKPLPGAQTSGGSASLGGAPANPPGPGSSNLPVNPPPSGSPALPDNPPPSGSSTLPVNPPPSGSPPPSSRPPKIKPSNEPMNLIFFGETGVGKSSLINTLANLLVCQEFDQAQQSEPQCVIPCSFSMTDENHNTQKIKVGDQTKMEANLNQGDSVTQEATSYEFDVDVAGIHRKVRIIDTPGVGDTRGIEQDKINIQNTIKYLNQYEGLNAICILLMPNASRFTLQFRYCFKELLVNLNRGSAPNICFCYTNSAGTFFRPGECHPLIMAELEKIEQEDRVTIPRKDNFFCFDSVVFRYLAANSQNVKFGQLEVDSYKNMWEKNCTSLNKLIAYAANLPQASVKPIFLLSTARRALMELSRPVADLSRNIQVNKKLAEDKKAELANLDVNATYSPDDLYIDQIQVELVPLANPKTVCNDSNCYEMVTVAGLQKINYNSDCHAPCFLDDVEVDVIAHPSIKKCHAFDEGKLELCMKCGHSWQLHLHVMRETRETQVQILDQSIQDMIDQKASTAEVIKNQLENIEKLIAQYEDEQKLLVDSCAKLARYIKVHGIKFYNPDLEEYLKLLIKEEESKKAAGGNNEAVIDGLRQVLANFNSEVAILQGGLAGGGDSIATEDDIHAMIAKLASMPMNGNTFVDMMVSTPGAGQQATAGAGQQAAEATDQQDEPME